MSHVSSRVLDEAVAGALGMGLAPENPGTLDPAERFRLVQRLIAEVQAPYVVVATCDGSLEGLRDHCALLYFAFASGGRRRSEVAAADLHDLHPLPEGGYVYRLEHSKTQQAGVSANSTPDKPVLGVASAALVAWLNASGVKEGAMFGGCGRPASALPPRPPPSERSCNVGRKRPDWTGISAATTFGQDS